MQWTWGLLLLLLLEELGRLQERIHSGQHDRRCAPGAYAHSATWGAATHECVSAPLPPPPPPFQLPTRSLRTSVRTQTPSPFVRRPRRLEPTRSVARTRVQIAHLNGNDWREGTGERIGSEETRRATGFSSGVVTAIHQINLRYSLYLFVVPFSHTNRRSRKCVSVPNYHEPHALGRKPAFASVLGIA